MSTDFDQFDDPALKSALRRLYADEHAPEGLRGRVLQAMADESVRPPIQLSLWRRPWIWSIAAVLVLGIVGVVAWSMLRAHDEDTPGGLDQALLVAMVQTHDACCKHEDHHGQGIPQDDWTKMGQVMGQRLQEPVLVANLETDGWQFRGAAICHVAGRPVAHLVFARPGQTMSVFSLPPSLSTSDERGPVYGACVEGHMIAGFATPQGVYCMVGHCPGNQLKLEEVRNLVTKHQTDLVSATVLAHGPDGALAALQ